MVNNPLSILLEKNVLTGPNYVDWLRNLRIVLSLESLGYVLEADIPPAPGADATEEEANAHKTWVKDDIRVRGYMLGSMSNELQRSHDKMGTARAVLLHVEELYGEHSRTARYEISRELFRARMSEGEKVGDHVLKMISMIERLEALDFPMDFHLQTDLILQSLPDPFSQFIVNFNMNEVECILAGLMNKLVNAQSQLKPNGKEVVLAISSAGPSKPNKKKKKKKKKKGKKQKGVLKASRNIGKGKAPMVFKGKIPKKSDRCLHCGQAGH